MRLLFCCEFYPPVRGGVPEVMRQVAERMVRAGHDVVVATTEVPERDFAVLNGVRIQQFKVAGNLARGLKGDVAAYRDFVVNTGADAVMIKAAQQWTFDALWPVLDRIAARKVFIPCGFSGLYEPIYAGYYRQIPEVLRKFDHLIFYAESYRDIDFARRHGVTDFSVVPNGADEAEFGPPGDPTIRAQLGLSDEDFVFLTVGTPILGKGHRELAEAFAKLDVGSRRAVLILNGQCPPDLPRPGRFAWTRRLTARLQSVRSSTRHADPLVQWNELRRSIAQANAQANKRILQIDLPRGELVDAFKAADLFVFASNVEYSPLVLFEAAAAGTPFLSVPVGNAAEIARWTGGGQICPAATDEKGYTRVDPSVLAREMRRLMNDPDARARLAASGKARWRDSFTWKAIAFRYEVILAGRDFGEARQQTSAHKENAGATAWCPARDSGSRKPPPSQFVTQTMGVSMLTTAAKQIARRTWTALAGGFHHRSAQQYEMRSARGTVGRDFPRIYAAWENERSAGGMWQSPDDHWFLGNRDLWVTFVEHVRDRTNLEIGSGPFGYLAPCYWMKRRIVIDPLIDEYRDYQIKRFGKTFWTSDIETHAVPAERLVEPLRGTVDGCIVSRNALDHMEDPLAALEAIGEYAASGCYLLVWSDIWHRDGGDVGHRNITKNATVLDKLLGGLGFDIIQNGAGLRKADQHIEYSRLARKR